MLLEHHIRGCKNGITLGVILISLNVFIYLFLPHLLHHGLIYNISFYIIFLSFPVISIIQTGIILQPFKVLFSIVFLTLCVSLFLFTVFTLLLYNIFDKNLIFDYLASLEDFNKSFGTFNGVSPLSKEEFNSIMSKNYSIKNQLNSYIFSLIPCILYSSLISLLIKRIYK